MWSTLCARGVHGSGVTPLTAMQPHDEDVVVLPSPLRTHASTEWLQRTAELLHDVSRAWALVDLDAMRAHLGTLDAYSHDALRPQFFVALVALGGVDLFVYILCRPLRLRTHDDVADMRRVLQRVLHLFADLVVYSSALGVYVCDRYPGFVFRLLELASLPSLCLSAVLVLEHMLSVVGPVLEIARTPPLVALLRRRHHRDDDDKVLAALCRVLVLLLLPAQLPTRSLRSCTRMLYPEAVRPTQRMHRVIDSNVLWLMGEDDLVRRLLDTCTLRHDGDDASGHSGGGVTVRAQQGNRVYVLTQPQPVAQTTTTQTGAEALAAATATADTTTQRVSSFNDLTQQVLLTALLVNDGDDDNDRAVAMDAVTRAAVQRVLAQWPYLTSGNTTTVTAGNDNNNDDDSSDDSRDDDDDDRTRVRATARYTSDRLPARQHRSRRHRHRQQQQPQQPTAPQRHPPPRVGSRAATHSSSSSSNDDEAAWTHETDDESVDTVSDNDDNDATAATAATATSSPWSVLRQLRQGLRSDAPLANAFAFVSNNSNNNDDGVDMAQRLLSSMGLVGGGGGNNNIVVDMAPRNNDDDDDDDDDDDAMAHIDLRWLLASGDERRRWHARAATLTPANDDNRAAFLGYGDDDAHSAAATATRFASDNDAMLRQLHASETARQRRGRRGGSSSSNNATAATLLAAHDRSAASDELHAFVVDSQSEVLFVLKTLISTFCFSRAWWQMRRCGWVSRALDLFVFAFTQSNDDVDDAATAATTTTTTASAHERDATSPAHDLPRYQAIRYAATPPPPPLSLQALPPSPSRLHERNDATCTPVVPLQWADMSDMHALQHDTDGRGHDGDGDSDDGNDDDYDAFARNVGVDMLADDEVEVAAEDEHRHGPNAMRKLELLHCLHEYWNAHGRHESALLHINGNDNNEDNNNNNNNSSSDDDESDGDKHQQQQQQRQQQQYVAVPPSLLAAERASAAQLGVRLARALLSRRHVEEACVEAALCFTLEVHLRAFAYVYGSHRDTAACPQSVLAPLLLRPLLEQRVYNATWLRGMRASLTPAKRFDGVCSVLAELLRFHYGNLSVLNAYVCDRVDLAHLNEPAVAATTTTTTTVSSSVVGHNNNDDSDNDYNSNSRRHHRNVASTPPPRCPPLARGEHESLGSVLLRRFYRYPCETSLLVRALVLSLTPALRSSHNYLVKYADGHTARVAPPQWCATSSDVVYYSPTRLTYVRRLSRRCVYALDARTHNADDDNAASQRPRPRRPRRVLLRLLRHLQRAPNRVPLRERHGPGRLTREERTLLLLRDDDDDGSCVAAAVAALPPLGPPASYALPLFGSSNSSDDDNSDDTEKLRQLAPLAQRLLGAPHKLLYAMLCPLHADLMTGTLRLCVLSTALLVFVREARLAQLRATTRAQRVDGNGNNSDNNDNDNTEAGAAAVHRLLRDVRALAAPRYAAWCADVDARRRRRRQRHASRDADAMTRHNDDNDDDSGQHHHHHSHAQQQHGCSSFALFGACQADSEAARYHRRYGGCFFRNLFRLLCVWAAHYWASPHYVETLFYYTEVAFGEYRAMLLYLLRVLPNYFFAVPPYSDSDDSDGSDDSDERTSVTDDASDGDDA